MSGPPKSPGRQNPHSPDQEEGASNQKTDGQNIYVFTPSKLKELGFVTKVEGGKTLLVKPQDGSSVSKHGANVQVERRKPSGTDLVRPVAECASTLTSAESPGRRRIIQGFSRHWFQSLKKDGFIKCPLRQCTFISLRHEDMCLHYIICNGRANNTQFVCPSCKCCLKTNDDLELHRVRTHGDSTIQVKIVTSSPRSQPAPPPAAVPLNDSQLIVRKRGYSKVHKQAWTIAVEEHGYVNCIFQNCIFMALSVDEMIQHYRCCNSKGLDQLYVCPQCKGGVHTQEKLDIHTRISHSGGDKPAAHSKPSQAPGTAAKRIFTKQLQASIVCPSYRDSSAFTKTQQTKPATSTKVLSPTKRPCYAPVVEQQPRSQCIVDPGTLVVQQRQPPDPAPGPVCTFIKRRPHDSAVELFPPKVCTFVKNSRLSRKRRSSAVDHEAADQKRRCHGDGSAGDEGRSGVDYYISEPNGDVACHEEIAHEPEHVVEAAERAEIESVREIARNEDVRIKCEVIPVAVEVSKTEMDGTGGSGSDVGRAELKIADRFVSDPIGSDLVGGLDNELTREQVSPTVSEPSVAVDTAVKLQAIKLEELHEAELQATKLQALHEAELKATKLRELHEAELQAIKLEELHEAELQATKLRELHEAELQELHKAELQATKLQELEEAKLRELEGAKLRELEEAKLQELEEAKLRELEEAKLRELEEAKLQELEEAKLQELEEAKLQELEEAKLRELEEANLQELEEAKLQELEEAKLRELEEAKLQELEEAKLRELEEAKLRELEEAKLQELEEAKLRELEEAKLQELEEAKLQELEEAKLQELEEAKLQELEEAKLRELEEAKLRELEEAKLRELEEAKLRELEEAKLQELEEAKLQELEEAKLRELEEAKLQELEEAKLRELEEAKLRELEEAKLQELEEAKLRELEEAKLQELEEAKLQELEEAKLQELEEAKLRELEEAKLRELEEAKLRELEEAKLRELEEAKLQELQVSKCVLPKQTDTSSETDLVTNFKVEAPVTEVPVTEVPVTEVPVTEATVTEVPVTEVPVTEATVTEATVTEVPAAWKASEQQVSDVEESSVKDRPEDVDASSRTILEVDSAPVLNVDSTARVGSAKNRGNRRKKGDDFVSASFAEEPIGGSNGKVVAEAGPRRGRPKKKKIVTETKQVVDVELDSVEPRQRRGRSGKDWSEPVLKTPTRGARRKGRSLIKAGDELPSSSVADKIVTASESVGPSEDVPKKDGRKRKAPEENPVPGDDQLEGGEVTNQPPIADSGRKRGRWTQKAEPNSQPGVSAAMAEIVATPCPTEKPSRGRKSAIAKFYEQMEVARGKVAPGDLVTCARCRLELTRKQFVAHNKSRHAALSWIDGEIPVDMNNLEQVRYCLSRTFVKKGKIEIKCELCKASKKSIEGFVAHLELYCQKSTAEQEAMRVECPVCARVMLPTSLKVHMGVSHKSGLPDPTATAPEPKELGRRAAATKAAELIASLKKEEVEPVEDPDPGPEGAIRIRELMTLFKKTGGPRKVNGLLNARLKNELKTNGTMACRNAGCSFASSEIEAMQMHYEMCSKIPPLGFRCIRCNFKCGDEGEMLTHVATEPGHGKKEQAEEQSYSDVQEQGSASEPDEAPDVNSKTPGNNRKSTLFPANRSASLASRVKFLSKEISARVMGDSMYLPSSRWWLDFQTENFRECLFPALVPHADDLLLLDDVQAAEYLPTEQQSIPISMLTIDSSGPRDPKTEPGLAWQRLGRFEATVVDGVPVMFVGGPVWAMAWCPIPTSLLLSSGHDVSQFLAVACHRGMDDVFTVTDGRRGSSAIQIWDFGPMDHSNECRAPRMALALAHNFGAVWHMEWCPSGCYDAAPADGSVRRMGLLAAACSDGRVHVFSVPFPRELATPTTYRWNVLLAAPVLSLVCGGSRPDLPQHDAWMCTRLSWFKNAGHAKVAGSFTNGLACVWDLGTTSSLLTRQCGRTRVVFAHKTFQAHLGSVTALSLFPYFEGRYLMTGGVDRTTKIWDLEQTTAPISTSSKGVVTDGVWLSHWVTTVTAYDDGFGIHHGNTMLHSVRNFGFNPYPLLAQNSPVWSISGSEWSNAIAQGTAAGELCVIFPHQLFIGADVEKGMKYKRMVIGYVDLVESGPRQGADKDPLAVLTPPPATPLRENVKKTLSVASSSRPGSELGSKLSSEFDESREVSSESESDSERCPSASLCEDKEFLSGTYEDIAEIRKMALCSYPLDDFKTFPSEGRDAMRTSELMRSVATEMYPVASINRVSWNPNCCSHLWLASGFHCGLVRVPCVRGMQNKLFARELFSEHVQSA